MGNDYLYGGSSDDTLIGGMATITSCTPQDKSYGTP